VERERRCHLLRQNMKRHCTKFTGLGAEKPGICRRLPEGRIQLISSKLFERRNWHKAVKNNQTLKSDLKIRHTEKKPAYSIRLIGWVVYYVKTVF
jgi:hypothetical protein